MEAFNRRMGGRLRAGTLSWLSHDAEAHVWDYSIRPEVGQVILSLVRGSG